jgi:stage III sporulation protein AG
MMGKATPKVDNKSDLWQRVKTSPYLLWAIVALAIVAAINLLLSQPSNGTRTPDARLVSAPTADTGTLQQVLNYQRTLETQLQEMLSRIQGAGEVSVMITLANGPEVKPLTNVQSSERNSEEKGADGRSVTTTETTRNEQVVTASADAGVAVQEATLPVINGVLVVASGASAPQVRAALTTAVATSLNVAPSRVVVVPGIEGGK